MHLSKKRLLIAFIILQLILLPILLFAAKKQQETRSQAAEEITEEQQLTQAGMADIEIESREDLSSSFQPEVQRKITKQKLQTSGISNNPKIKKEVYGFLWYPYVDSDSDKAESYLQYPYLTTLAYAGLVLKKEGVINKNNAPYNVWQSQRLKKILTDAKVQGVKIHPRIATFETDNVNFLLETPERRQKAVLSIIEEIKNAPVVVDGVNIDFEPVPLQSREEFSDFIKNLRSEMNKLNPDLEIVIDTFSSTALSEGGFDLEALTPYVNGFFVMSFTLVDQDSAEKASSLNPYKSLNKVADNYLTKVPSDKIILGFPFYTARWNTEDNSFRSINIRGKNDLIFYKDAHAQAKAYGEKYNDTQKTAWYSYYDCAKPAGWKQVYFDNEQALTEKFKIVNLKNLKGVGFWTFNQDRSLDTWKAIYNSFANKNLIGTPTLKPGATPEYFTPDPNCKIPSPTPSPLPGSTIVNLSIGLDGIGVTKRIPSGGNKNPKNRTRTLEVKIYKASDNTLVFSNNQVFSFNSLANRFDTSITLPSSFEGGIYNLYVLGNPYLIARYPGSVTITRNQTVALVSDDFNLVTGDVNKNQDSINRLNILDYNVLISCSVFSKDTARSVCNQNPEYLKNSDLDDNGIVNQDDITLLIKEMGNQSGDILPQ